MFRNSRRMTIAVVFLVITLCSDAIPQNPQSSENRAKASSPGSTAVHPQPESWEQYVAYWTTEPGWHTELQLRNNLDPGDLVVTAALRTFDGKETALPDVTIKSGDVVSFDLGDTLLKTAPQLIGSYGSIVLRYTSVANRALFAAVMVRDDGHPIAFHIDAYLHSPAPTTASREGIWWLPRDSVTDYLVLSNSGPLALSPRLTIFDSYGRGWSQKLSLAAYQTQRLSVRSLLQKAGLQGSYGGVRLDQADTAAYLDSIHIIYDELGGFGAMMKMFNHDPAITLASHSFGGVKEWTTRAPMLALSDPDAALGFPAGTILQPTVFVRNTSLRTYTAHIRFNWRSATATGKTRPIDLILKPNATQVVDVAALQAQKVIPTDAHWAAVILSAPVQPDDLMALAASYDETGRYGAQTPFSDQLASHWEGGQWEVDGTHNSLVAIANASNKPARAELTILYNHGSEKYQMEQILAPEEQIFVDFGKLIREQTPDKHGHVLPADLTTGTYRIRDLADNATGSVYEGKLTVDKTYGHAAYGCGICCGPETPFMQFNPLGVAVAGFSDQQVEAYNSCSGGTETVTSAFPTWSTANQAIATATKNQINGIASGTTEHSALSVQRYWGQKIYASSCPVSQAGASGGTNVQAVINGPTTVWWFNGQNPNPTNYPISITLTANCGASGCPATPQWSVTEADKKVNLSATSGTQITITSTGTYFSKSVGDISFTASVNGISSPAFTITSRTPWELVADPVDSTTEQDSDTGYNTVVASTLNDQLASEMASDFAWNESVGAPQNANGSNWATCCGPLNTSAGTGSPLLDRLVPPLLSDNPSPKPTYNSPPSGSVAYMTATQNIYIGSSTSEAGVFVQQDTLTYYIDHGAYTGIVIPPKPPQ